LIEKPAEAVDDFLLGAFEAEDADLRVEPDRFLDIGQSACKMWHGSNLDVGR
jgi:hypothetical protein